MGKLEWIGIAATILISVLLFSACSKDDASKEFVVAAVVPKTGPIGYLGEQEVAGLQLAADDLNKRGGIGGRLVRVAWEDTGGDVAKAVTATNKLLANGKVDMLFVTTSGAVKAVAPLAASKNIPLFAMASDIGLTRLNPYIFRLYMNFDDEQRILSSYLSNINCKRTVMLRPEDEAFSNAQQALVRHMAGRVGNLSGVETFTRKDKEFRVHIEKLLLAKPDCFLVLGYGGEYPVIIEQIKQNPRAKDVHIVGGYALISRAAQQNGTTLFQDVHFVSFAAIDAPSQDTLAQRVTQHLGRPAGQFLDYVFAYDSLMFVEQAARNQPMVSLIEAINRTQTYQGVGGNYSLPGNRDATVPLAIAQFSDGKAVIVWNPKP